jgi:hypothetical protein
MSLFHPLADTLSDLSADWSRPGRHAGPLVTGDTTSVATVARTKDELRAWRLGGGAGMDSAENVAELSRGPGRCMLAVPRRNGKEIEPEAPTRPCG